MRGGLRRGRQAFPLAVAAALVLVGVSAAAAGDLDPSFGGDGIVVGPRGYGEGLVIQDDGKLVTAGGTDSGGGFQLVRYNGDGSLDPSFGGDGIVTTQVGDDGGTATALALQEDGKLVAAGIVVGDSLIALVRYEPDGRLDATFGDRGIVLTNIVGVPWELVVQEDGKLIVSAGSESFELVRFNRDGSLDTSFDGDGVVITPIGRGAEYGASAVVLQEDGKLVAAGSVRRKKGYDFGLVRYHPDGRLDSTFGGNGKVMTPIGPHRRHDDHATALAIQDDGRLVAAGWVDANGRAGVDYHDFAVARYNTNGSLDVSFDGDGKAITSIGSYDEASALVIQTDGKLVAGGSQGANEFALVRYERDGSLDASFGGDGKVTTPVGEEVAWLAALVLQADAKIVAAGTASLDHYQYYVGLVRYLG